MHFAQLHCAGLHPQKLLAFDISKEYYVNKNHKILLVGVYVIIGNLK